MNQNTPPSDNQGPVRNPLGNPPATPNIGGVGSAPPGVPPSDEYKSSRGGGGRIFLFLLIVLAAVALGYYVYQEAIDTEQHPPPVVSADEIPLKLSPDQAGIDDPPPPDLNIYDVIEGKSQPQPHTDATQKPSVQGNLESLLDDIDKLPSTPHTPPPIAQAPSTSDITMREVPPANMRKYMVQLASLRSRAQARASYSTLQKRHAELLAAREPFILRVDLGERGVYYRLNVLGFAGLADSKEFCEALKARNQDCLVVKQP